MHTTALRRFMPSALPALAWMAVIFAASSVPGKVRAPGDELYRIFAWLAPNVQNLLHIPEFGMLAWLWQRAFRQSMGNGLQADVLAVVVTVTYGCLDEWHQYHVPGRYPSLSDVMLDLIGALLAVSIGRALLRRTQTAPQS